MHVWCSRVVLALALAVMPLQGIAATLSTLMCHGNGQAHVLQLPGHADAVAHPGSPQDESGAISPIVHHPCCNHIFSAPPVAVAPAALPDFPLGVLAPDLTPALFFPEQPQRPPLA